MTEPVRLVIWDLDDTFWEGTVTEGGIENYIQENQNIVIELSKRGIMSSICSKNDYQEIKEILIEKGVWEYFVFPSIDWSPKSYRVKKIIEDIQLRPETVVFIDDNHMNRAEVLENVPGIRVEDENYIKTILDDPLYKGKNDHNLSRLKQYKILEKRQHDKQENSSDNLDFLRKSEITVTINHNVEDHLDRVVELINRTNQLNFTKNRLSDNPEEAKKQILYQLNDIAYAKTAGLVHVKDKYGDYGYCGFYLKETFHSDSRLIHFCFSCRILGMGVETWLYQKLSSPNIKISGEVLTDIKKNIPIDWINIKRNSDKHKDSEINANKLIFRGGCDLDSVAHYFNYDSSKILLETNYVHNRHLIRRDSIVNIITGINGLSKEDIYQLSQVGLKEKDFSIDFLRNPEENDVIILSLWGDTGSLSYRCKSTNLAFMMLLQGVYIDYVHAPDELIHSVLCKLNADDNEKKEILRWIIHIKDQYESFFYETETFRYGIQKVISLAHPKSKIILLKPSSKIRSQGGEIYEDQWKIKNRSDIDKVVSDYGNVFSVDVMECIHGDEDIVDVVHFGRMVYYRIYKKVLDIIG